MSLGIGRALPLSTKRFFWSMQFAFPRRKTKNLELLLLLAVFPAPLIGTDVWLQLLYGNFGTKQLNNKID